MSDFNEDHNCFVCGQDNQAGLRLEFQTNASSQEVEAEVAFPRHMQGWRDTVHGGLLATVLDEAMVKAAIAQDIKCVTAEITVKYRKPVATNVSYQVSGKILESRGRVLLAESRIHDSGGQTYAQATGKLFKAK
jgi:uncharacterized protein (TIGR00369 family)